MLSIGTYATFTNLHSLLANMALLYIRLREVTNAFCSNDDDTTVQKLVTRLNNVAESEKMLMRLIACTPSFVIQGYTLKPGVEEASSKDSGKQKSIIVSH